MIWRRGGRPILGVVRKLSWVIASLSWIWKSEQDEPFGGRMRTDSCLTGQLWAMVGKGKPVGAAAQLTLVGDFPSCCFLTGVAFDILVASGLSANIVRVHVWTFLRFLSYIREKSKDLSPLCILFSFLFPPKCPLPLSYLWQGPGIIEQSGNKGCGHSITCVWWVSGGPYTCIWLNCGDQWPSPTYQGSKFFICSDALLSHGTSVLPLCPY